MPESTDDLLRRLDAARERQEVHERVVREARDEVRALVRLLKDRHTLDEVVRLTGMTKAAVEYALLAEHAPSRQRKRERPTVPAPPAPGISVAEASRRLGVSRPTVYAWIEAGRVAAVEHLGRTRVVVDEQGRVLDSAGQPVGSGEAD